MTNLRSLRLTPYSSSSLANVLGQDGEIFYDRTNRTIRIFDGKTRNGYALLRADLSNISGSIGASISDTPPANPQKGSQWLNSITGVLYIYYVNSNGTGQWIQPINFPYGTLPQEVALPTATLESIGAVRVDGDTITVTEDGTITAVTTTSYLNSTFVGVTTTSISATVVNAFNDVTGTVNYDVAANGALYHNYNVLSNFTANFTNVHTTNNRASTIILIIDQGNPAYIANAVQIEGVPQQVNWVGGLEPVGHIGNTDVMTFVLLRTNDAWTVFGSLATHGV